MSNDLNERQQLFLDNLFTGMSKAEAYNKAGYKSKDVFSASANANRLLKNDKVKPEYERRKAEAIDDAKNRMKEMLGKAMDEWGGLLDYSTPMDSVKIRAILALVDRLGMKPPDKVEHSGQIEHTITLHDIILATANDDSNSE